MPRSLLALALACLAAVVVLIVTGHPVPVFLESLATVVLGAAAGATMPKRAVPDPAGD
ncbi:hypothetical protein ACIPQA_33600 [Streptomyces sp. NPDC090109]|uniref:hypothetical protein n=1 Tax=Streptomyces sp. NPDC090109 TaxID=3365948 RepID=UPI00380CA524